jgi:hypothetical protein
VLGKNVVGGTMTKNELLRKLEELIEHEDRADFKLAIEVAIEVISTPPCGIRDSDVEWAYKMVAHYYEK